MRMKFLIVLALCGVAPSEPSEVYFKDKFDTLDAWVQSNYNLQALSTEYQGGPQTFPEFATLNGTFIELGDSPEAPTPRGKEMSLSRCIGLYYKLPKSDPYAVY